MQELTTEINSLSTHLCYIKPYSLKVQITSSPCTCAC
uniref:Uncharacterized protein n=1 Tax=Rhizophora mucronata TaxID=61149 RepID=A0A2P2QW56_RHIMU